MLKYSEHTSYKVYRLKVYRPPRDCTWEMP